MEEEKYDIQNLSSVGAVYETQKQHIAPNGALNGIYFQKTKLLLNRKHLGLILTQQFNEQYTFRTLPSRK